MCTMATPPNRWLCDFRNDNVAKAVFHSVHIKA